MILNKVHPKIGRTILYKTNGTGRDTYVYNDNGGLCAARQAPNYARGTFPFRRVANSPAPAMEGKQMVYKSDGTGRDNYIR